MRKRKGKEWEKRLEKKRRERKKAREGKLGRGTTRNYHRIFLFAFRNWALLDQL